MATFESGWVASDDWKVREVVTVTNVDNDTSRVSVTVYGVTWLGWDSHNTSVTINCNGQTQTFTGAAMTSSNGTFNLGSRSFNVSRSGTARNINVSAKVSVPQSGAASYRTGATASGSVSIPARTRTPHGNPTISASATEAVYGEQVTLTWGKSATQGNANFDRFELWQGSTRLYSGTGTSMAVTPSDVTGAKGGTATYEVREIHDWYGTEYTTKATVSIEVKGGVVTAYDGEGAARAGLVTAYGADGAARSVLITAYDAEGQPCRTA